MALVPGTQGMVVLKTMDVRSCENAGSTAIFITNSKWLWGQNLAGFPYLTNICKSLSLKSGVSSDGLKGGSRGDRSSQRAHGGAEASMAWRMSGFTEEGRSTPGGRSHEQGVEV